MPLSIVRMAVVENIPEARGTPVQQFNCLMQKTEFNFIDKLKFVYLLAELQASTGRILGFAEAQLKTTGVESSIIT